MATARRGAPSLAGPTPVPALRNGERLDQPAFHQRYEAMPPSVRAELIGGIVHIMPPLSKDHGWTSVMIIGWLADFVAATPGVRAAADATLILGSHSEPQPDAVLYRLPAHGGRARLEGTYLAGAPELVVEIALSSSRYDLHEKREEYERAGVDEYVIVLLRDSKVVWLTLESGRYQEAPADEEGILRSRVFPGLWLDAAALLDDDLARVKATLQRGLAGCDE